jgi:hypothetical protein
MLRTLWLVMTMTLAALAQPAAAQYRGMAVGWPHRSGGNYAAYYPGNAPSGGPAYYVARPTTATLNYGQVQYAPGGYTTYMPVTAAYANPAYTAGYGAPGYAASYAQQPMTTAYYGGTTAAYYAPAQSAYAPLQSYRVSPAGGVSTGGEAFAGYGQPTTINYVPPRFSYRTAYAPVPVYMYRPVTVYDPVTAQPVTCLQPTTVTGCQAQRHRWFGHGWFSWLKHGGCGAAPAPAAVPMAAPTVTYCAGGACQAPCGQQPYYPMQPQVIIPAVPAPGTAPPSIYTPIPAGPTIPPPGTRIIPGPGATPADIPPNLNPGGRILQPGMPVNPLPRSTTPGVPLFPVDPSGGGQGASYSPSGAGYAAPADPYSGSGLSGPVLRAPTAPSPPAFNPGIQPVPDPAAGRSPRPASRAPQLLDPRDKTANPGDQRWGVVPAVWPTKDRPLATQAIEQSPYRVYRERSLSTQEYDDSGWTSSR